MRLVFRKNRLSPKKTIEETNNKYNQKNKRKGKKNRHSICRVFNVWDFYVSSLWVSMSRYSSVKNN